MTNAWVPLSIPVPEKVVSALLLVPSFFVPIVLSVTDPGPPHDRSFP